MLNDSVCRALTRFVAAICIAAMLAGPVGASGGSGGGVADAIIDGCPDSGFFSRGRFISDLCWTCFFPIKIFGVPIPMSGRSMSKAPSSTASPMCVCPGRFGWPAIGVTFGMWLPTHMIELTRRPFCSPILFGLELNAGGVGNAISGLVLQGTPGEHTNDNTAVRGSFYNFHWMSFPVGELTDMMTNSLCSKGGADLDYLYFTELDPTWTSEMLALYTHPEIKLFTKIYAHAVCAADAVMATVTRPIEQAFWCAGTWGMLYPFAGKGTKNNSPEAQMLVAAKGIAAMHRRGLAKLTYKDMAICSDSFYFIMPKQQYQLQNMWPWPQRNQAQWVGASSWRWGQWRNAPAVFEDRVIVQWTYSECCLTAW